MQTHSSDRVLFVGETADLPTKKFNVTVTNLWREAVRLAREESFAVILVDLAAPQIDESTLKELAEHVTVFWFTEGQTNELALTAAKAGVFQLHKPASERDLERALSIAVERARPESTTPLRSSANSKLQELSKEFDELVAHMQTPKSKAGARRLFSASPEEFGAAAVAGARKQRG